MTRKEALTELLARVEVGDNPGQGEWYEAFPDTPYDDDYPQSVMTCQACVGWVDAVKSLERTLRGSWLITITETIQGWKVTLAKAVLDKDHNVVGDSVTAYGVESESRTRLAAFLKALIAECDE